MKYIAVAIIIVFILGGLTFAFFGNRPIQQEQPQPQITKPTEKVAVEDIKVGTGAEAKTGNTVSVQYTGTLLDGKKFDSSYDHGQPLSFTLGQGQVIQGWDQGVLGMKIGGKRKLTIPPSLAYGATAIPGLIPANSTLVFEIELLGVK